MKKLLFILLLISPSLCFAQFYVSEGGLKVRDSDNPFVVYDFNGMTSQELYNKAKTAITGIYVSAKDVVSSNEGEILSINAISTNKIYMETMGHKDYFDMNYNINFRFKDNKIRVDSPTINYIKLSGSNPLPLLFERGKGLGLMSTCIYLYKKNGEVRYPDVIRTSEDLLNGIVLSIMNGVKSKDSSNDW